MPADQLEAFVDSPAMREAVTVVFERTNEGSEEVQWEDVQDTLSSGEWGRLIEEGVLVSGSTGFVLDSPDDVEAALEPDEPSDVDEIESESWEWHDKMAGLVALGLFAGYWNSGIRDVVASFDNLVLGPVTHAVPFYAVVLLLATVTGFYSSVIQSKLMDKEKMEAYQERMSELNERREKAKERGDDEALERIQDEQMDAAGDQLGMFKLQFRPMVWIMLLTIPVFLWLRWKVRGGHLSPDEMEGLVLPMAGHVGWQDPLFGPMSTWIVWYFLGSLVARQLIQKTLELREATREAAPA